MKQARTRNSSCQAGYSESFTTYSTVHYITLQYCTVKYSESFTTFVSAMVRPTGNRSTLAYASVTFLLMILFKKELKK